MKKTFLIALLLGCLTGFASAGMKVGITASGYELDMSGKESSLGGGADQSRAETVEGATLSIFAEHSIDALKGLTVGIDIVPYEIDMGAVENKRDAKGSSKVGTTHSDGQNGTNTASVDMQYPTTFYLLLPSEQGLYLKAGLSYTNLKTAETLTTGTSYPDLEIWGGHLNIGYEHALGEAFVRAEVGISEWEEAVVKSSSGRNTVTANLDGTNARISIGKAF